jgi:hypothetical protein
MGLPKQYRFDPAADACYSNFTEYSTARSRRYSQPKVVAMTEASHTIANRRSRGRVVGREAGSIDISCLVFGSVAKRKPRRGYRYTAKTLPTANCSKFLRRDPGQEMNEVAVSNVVRDVELEPILGGQSVRAAAAYFP